MAETITFPGGTFARPCLQKLTHFLSGAFHASAIMLDDRPRDNKAFGLAIGMVMGVTLFNRLAGLADKELREVTAMAMVAGDKGVQGFNTVDKA